MKLSDSHISLSATQAVNKICAPLFNATDVHYFHYAKVYDNGGVSVLVSNPYFHKHFWENKYDKSFFKLWKPGIFFNEPGANQILADARNYFNIDHLMMILQRKDNYYEAFAFATQRSNHAITSFYLNNLELLTKFGYYFRDQSKKLINIADKELIFTSEYKPITSCKDSISEKLSDILDFNNDDCNQITNEIKGKLSKRQYDCIYYLSKGMSIKQIANNLKISPRTVEEHIAIAKTKLNCYTRSQLIDILHSSN